MIKLFLSEREHKKHLFLQELVLALASFGETQSKYMLDQRKLLERKTSLDLKNAQETKLIVKSFKRKLDYNEIYDIDDDDDKVVVEDNNVLIAFDEETHDIISKKQKKSTKLKNLLKERLP